MKMRLLLLLLTAAMNTGTGYAQKLPVWSQLTSLPDSLGWAGMYAGVSHDVLFCMGGANFPNGLPWEGGQKKWSDAIYRLDVGVGKQWQKCTEKLPVSAGYGVSVSYRNRIITVGGSNQNGHLQDVTGYEWDGTKLQSTAYPSLPVPLANMAGDVVEHVLIIAGGSHSATASALRSCYGLDLDKLQNGWFVIDPWPGPERTLAVCAVHKNQFYLFSGETTGKSAQNVAFRHILQDAYRLTLSKTGEKWRGVWTKLAPMPRGASAAGTPLPVLNNGYFLIWGGVDAVTALYKTPATHPGITNNALLYDPKTDIWAYAATQRTYPSRVTLPVVFWNDQWLYVSGEIKPGIRTNTVVAVE